MIKYFYKNKKYCYINWFYATEICNVVLLSCSFLSKMAGVVAKLSKHGLLKAQNCPIVLQVIISKYLNSIRQTSTIYFI